MLLSDLTYPQLSLLRDVAKPGGVIIKGIRYCWEPIRYLKGEELIDEEVLESSRRGPTTVKLCTKEKGDRLLRDGRA